MVAPAIREPQQCARNALCSPLLSLMDTRFMAGSSLLVLIDDIAAVLDDVALMTKMAAKKTSGVLGDDLALNAQQVSGVRAERKFPWYGRWRRARSSIS